MIRHNDAGPWQFYFFGFVANAWVEEGKEKNDPGPHPFQLKSKISISGEEAIVKEREHEQEWHRKPKEEPQFPDGTKY
jgi:hypothetical protein